jgi:hypothetical protein
MCAGFKSLVELNSFYFQLLKLIGVFPFLLEHETPDVTSPCKGTKVLERVRFYKSGKYIWIRYITMSTFVLHSSFSAYHLFMAVFFLKVEFHSVVVLACWIMGCTAGITTAIVFHLKREKVCDLLTNWHHMEHHIYRGYFSTY